MPVWMVFFGWLGAGLFLSPWDARAQTGPYDTPSGIQSPGRVMTDYITASMRRQFRIQVASEALERCGQCASRASLQADYDRLLEEDRQVRVGEGLVMQSLHLPYKDFRELAGAMWLGLRPGYDVMPPEVRDARMAMTRAILNYCYAVSNTPNEVNACRKVYALNNVIDIVVNAPPRCFSAVQDETGIQLYVFPAPDAPPSEQKAHTDAVSKYKVCVQGNDLFQMMRDQTNKICGVADIGPTLEPDQFICACKGRAPPAEKTCPASAVASASPSVIKPLMHSYLADELLDGKPYGRDLLGIQIGMPMSKAEEIIRKHMQVDDQYATGLADKGDVTKGGYRNRNQLESITQGFQGKLFVSSDQFEYIAIFDAPPNLPGRVAAVSRAAWVPVGGDVKEIDDMVAKNGKPFGSLTAPRIIWGDSVDACAALFDTSFDGAIWVKDHIALPEHRREDSGIAGHLLVPRLPHFRADKCRPMLMLSTGGNPNRAGRPMLIIEKLYDLGLATWFQDQRLHNSGP
jgi:hypothetical protein